MIIKVPVANVAAELQRIGVHPAGCSIMQAKGSIMPLKLCQVRTPAANILKQEMLAAGGDCAVPQSAVTCAERYCDVLLLGTRAQYERLLHKLKAMSFFGIGKLSGELDTMLHGGALVTVLPDGRRLLYDKTLVMGIINVNNDSFFAASRKSATAEAVAAAGRMLTEGASILDIGGESTRPGAQAVSAEEEIERVVPVIKGIKDVYPESVLSVDTYHAATAAAALEVGVSIVNDISAGEGDASMVDVVLKHRAPLILMHKRGVAADMQLDTVYEDVVAEVAAYLLGRCEYFLAQGLTKEQLILDPGIGFAKDTEGNLRLINNLAALTGQGYPVLLGASRKSFIGQVLQMPAAEDRLEGTLALTAWAFGAGTNIVRVHDVSANVKVLRMLEAVVKCQ